MSVTSHYMAGFEHATGWLLDESHFPCVNNWHAPPAGLPDCPGCKDDRVVENDCPKCQYELGFTEGASK